MYGTFNSKAMIITDLGIDIKLYHLISKSNIINVNYLLNISNVLDIAYHSFQGFTGKIKVSFMQWLNH